MKFKNLNLICKPILKYKEYSLLNVIGLAIGMASAMIIFLWADLQVSMDNFHQNGKNIYVLRKQMKFSDGQVSIDLSITSPLGPALSSEVPEIKAAVRIPWNSRSLFRLGEKSFFEDGIYADSTFFRVFSFPFLHGDASTALNNPNTVVISEKLAKKYFNTTNVIGKTITIRTNKESPFTVTGVVRELPRNSSFKFDYVLPFSKYYENNKDWLHWGNYSMRTYVLAQPGVSQAVLNKKMTAVLHKYDDWAKRNAIVFAQPFEEAWLHGDFGQSMNNPSGLILFVRIFLSVALFIILLACMNYTNLSTALAIKRAKEVGLKKVFGSDRRKLVGQFIAESLLLTFVSFFLSITIIHSVLPYFNTKLHENIALDFSNFKIVGFFIIVPLVTGLVAGIFPAVYLSSFKPIVALKGLLRPGKGKIQLRHTLVVFQFIVTIAFIVSSLVVQKQISYIQHKNLGLDKDNVMIFYQSAEIVKHRAAFKEELEKLPGVMNVTYTNNNPLEVGNSTTDPKWRGKSPNDEFLISVLTVDQDFARTMGVEIIEGRDFSMDFPADTNCVLINQEMAKIMHLENPVGEVISYWGRKATVAGIVKDFHFNNMHVPIKQMMLICRPNDTWVAMVKVKGGQIKEAVRNIEKVFLEYENIPFEYRFLDEEFTRQYASENNLGWLAMVFTVLAIIISCLGLFGLSLFTAEQRTKEIGVRKSNGATTLQIMMLLARDFTKWILIAFVIASAIAYFLLRSWLNGFAYKTDLSWWIFVLTGTISFAIALITVSWQSYRAACKNPVESLRYE